jgi:5S rRNA maturation endonuclease (ribonuclease M5)
MTFAEKKIDYGLIPVIDVARELFGQASGERTVGDERHFDGHAGLFVNLKKNRWYCHGESTGGDAIDLIRFANACDYKAAFDWLRSHGYERFLGERPTPQQRRVVSTYNYIDESGGGYHIDRSLPKSFSQWRMVDGERVNGVAAGLYERSPFGNRAWYRVKDEPRPGAETREFPSANFVPYRLPELIASGDAPVLIAGGEKDVDNLRALGGLTATCNHGGEGKWWPELTPYLKDRRVFILCDNDEQGEKHQQVVGAALNGVAREIRVVRFPELEHKGDVSDFIEQRRKDGLDDAAIKKELALRFREAPAWEPTEPIPTAEAPNSPSVTVDTGDGWPEPLSLPEGLSPVDALDPALLPKAIAPWVCDISERMQCPPDYVGSTALTALGSVLGRRIGIAPDRQTDWFEVPNLWQCAVGRPGAMKTPAIGEARLSRCIG